MDRVQALSRPRPIIIIIIITMDTIILLAQDLSLDLSQDLSLDLSQDLSLDLSLCLRVLSLVLPKQIIHARQ
jgi:hypothetical protein